MFSCEGSGKSGLEHAGLGLIVSGLTRLRLWSPTVRVGLGLHHTKVYRLKILGANLLDFAVGELGLDMGRLGVSAMDGAALELLSASGCLTSVGKLIARREDEGLSRCATSPT